MNQSELETLKADIQKGYDELLKRNQATIDWLVKYGFKEK
jgi:hypothetical protein